MAELFEQTLLWKNSLGMPADGEISGNTIERLRATYRTLRSRAATLTNQIGASFPNLTVHDITHLDALWETGSIITGKNFKLNPLEGFILGGAFLLHDAALCFEAYEGGKSGLRSTLEWQDTYALERYRDPAAPASVIENRADFSAARALHASRAKELGSQSWSGLYLIDDTEIRRNYGPIIGEIASSHHWSIEEVREKFQTQLNAPSGFPRDWSVDPLKIACVC